MTGRSMTDAQLAAALRAHLPAHAHAGLRDRISAEIAGTRQATRLSWLFGLGSSDPMGRRRGILVLAALALVAAATVAAAVGAWLRSQQQDQDLPRAHAVDAFVQASYLDFAELPEH